jgi:hypothetical protein
MVFLVKEKARDRDQNDDLNPLGVSEGSGVSHRSHTGESKRLTFFDWNDRE